MMKKEILHTAELWECVLSSTGEKAFGSQQAVIDADEIEKYLTRIMAVLRARGFQVS